MASIARIKGSDGSSNASLATIQSTRSPLASTIDVDTVAGIPANFMGSMGTPHTFIDPVTSEEITVISEATCVDFAGHVNGSDLEIDTIAPGYTDLGSDVGDVVIIRPTTQYADNIAAVLAVILNDDGTLKSNIVAAAKMVNAGVFTGDAASTFPALTIGNGKITPDKLALGGAQNTVDTSETITGTSYGDLATVGPSVTVTIGANGCALLIMSCSLGNDTANGQSLVGFVASGANTIAATDNKCIKYTQVPAGGQLAESQVFYLTGLTPGATTFRLKYRAGSNQAVFQNRNLAVIPL